LFFLAGSADDWILFDLPIDGWQEKDFNTLTVSDGDDMISHDDNVF